MSWIGVDLDGTLAEYGSRNGANDIGNPVPKMLARVKKWLSEGKDVRIFTARACIPEQIPAVEAWCLNWLEMDDEIEVLMGKDIPISKFCGTILANGGEIFFPLGKQL